jgi:hypothetical protein
MKLDRTNQLLLATSVVLLAFTGLQIWRSAQPPAPLVSVAPVQALQVYAIDVRRADRQLRLERAERWAIAEPRALSADEERIGEFLREWGRGFTPDLRLQPGDTSLAEWGLDPTSRTVVRLEGDAGVIVELYLGARVSGGGHYLMWSGDGGVYRGRVPGSHLLDLDVDAWRDSRLFPFAKDDLAGLVLDAGHGRFGFRRVETETRAYWIADEDTDFEPSSRALDGIARSLSDVKAAAILEGEDAAAARTSAGLGRAGATLITEVGTSWDLTLGEPTDGGVFAAIEGDPRLFVLPKGAANQISKDRATLRDRTILRFDRTPNARLTWTQGEHRLVLAADGERGWAVAEPAGWDAGTELALAANSLVNLQALDVFDVPHPEPGPDSIRLDVEDTGTQRSVYLVPDGGRWLAYDPERQPTFELRGAVLDRLLRTFGARTAG